MNISVINKRPRGLDVLLDHLQDDTKLSLWINVAEVTFQKKSTVDARAMCTSGN